MAKTASRIGQPGMSGIRLPMRVWDAPIRLFHWGITLLLAFSWLSANEGWLRWHRLSGYAILAALLFRVAWGFVGSDTARFSAFLKNPLEGFRHLAAIRTREPDTEIGHNAAGGWMVLFLLAVLAIQVGTGLFANTFDDEQVNGPLATRVARATSDSLTNLHALNFNIILALVALHVVAIGIYAWLKGQNLLRPMLTGKKKLPGNTPAPRMASPLLAIAIFAVAAGAVAVVASLGS